MNMILLVIGIGLFFGIALGAYIRLLYSLRSVVKEWHTLLNYALAKRQALLALAQFVEISIDQLHQEIFVLSQMSSLSWRSFLKNSYEAVPLFLEMEERSFQEAQNILTMLNDCIEREKVLPYLEIFWAKKNLFAFAATHYDRAVHKYLEQRSLLCIWPFSKIFQFSSIPDDKVLF